MKQVEILKENQDEEFAKKLFEDEQREIEEEMVAAILKEKEGSKRKTNKNQKASADRKKFVDFMKACGYSGN